ncbi:MAG: serine/threonine protein kinase [Deltaproteobacteria bacterium]|nr:serine/threonine protein kinase [Deltaproteobacteria bacterium]
MKANVSVEPFEATQVSGKRLGRYVLRYEIASGGMGEVYLAQMRGPAGVERWVALKVLRPEIAAQQKFVTMFLDEARIASRLSHPNLCAVVDFGQADGRYFLALEYLHGETLSKVVRRLYAEAMTASGTSMVKPVDLICRMVADAARGLHAAHEARGADGHPLGIVHRDVSPQNVFILYDGVAKVMDFGIASARGRESHTMTGEVKGKFAYMSPEQLSGKKVDRRTDVFALGIVLWESVVGRRLFRAESEGETVLNVMSKQIPAPSALARGIPPAVDRIVVRALERDADRRYPTAAAMADDLEEFLASLGRPAGASQVSGLMRRLFADRIVTRDAMLRAPSLPADIVPELELESGSSIRTVSPAARTVSSVAGLRKPRLWIPAAMLGIAAMGGIALWAASERGDGAPTNAPPVAQPVLPPLSHPPPGPAPQLVAPVPALPQPSPAPTVPDGDAPPGSLEDAPPPSRQAPPAARAAASGTLNLLTTPTYATVFLGGRRLGTTPLFQKRLPSGRHSLRLVPGSGGAEKRVTVEIRPGKLTSLSVRVGGI